MKLIALLIVFAFGLAACQDKDATTRLAVQYAAVKFVRSDDDPAAKAAKVRAVIEEVRAAAKGESSTVAALKVFVAAKLPADMLPEDRLLANALIDAVSAELEARVGDGVLDPEKLVKVDVVLGWVSEATLLVG
jgi:hypothetical protein